MPTPQIPKVNDNASLEELRDCYIGMNRYLTYLLTALDTQNISRLDAKVIIAESITAGKLAADSVETGNLQAGAVTAEKITVNELSAISANLGHITAGLIESIRIFGSYIATRNGSFPRAELNNVGDLLAVYTDANNSVVIKPGITNTPNLVFTEGGVQVGMIGPAFGILGFQGNEPMVLGTTNGEVTITCGPDDYVTVPSWSKLINASTGYSLQHEFDLLRAEIAEKADISHSHSVSIPTHVHNPATSAGGGGTFSVS